MTKRYRTADLCNLVYEAVISGGRPMTRLEICRAIGRHKSPHIIAMIDHLNATGYINRMIATNVRGEQEFRYYIDPPAIRSELVDKPDENA